MTDLLPNKANQFTFKVDHHFNDAAALSGFVLRQVTHEANTNYNPVNDFVGSSYQLDRVIKTFVVNNTYVLSSSTVLTLRGGYNKFDDNYNLNDRSGNPLNFNVSTLGWPAGLVSQMSDTQRFPSMTITGYKGSGWTTRQANGYYQYGANGTLSRLAGTHSLKMGGDFRKIGATSLNYGASTGTFTFSGTYTGNALADLLMGYPQSGSVPLNAELDGYVNYFSGYAQDDWRVNNKLTINYGLRLEHETGLMEKNNQQTVNFDQTAVSPLNSQVTFLDPITKQPRQLMGGLVYAGVNGAPTVQGNQPKIKPAPRVGAVFSFNDKTVLRGGWGLYFSPWNYPAAGTTGWGQIGYSATTNIPQPSGVPTVSMSNPFPSGLTPTSGNTLGLLTGTGGDITFIDPNKGAPRVQQYSFDLQRELPGGVSVSVGYTGLTGANLDWGGSININQIDPKYQSQLTTTATLVTNPFFGVAAAGSTLASRATIEIGQLLRPFPQFAQRQHVAVDRRPLAVPRRHLPDPQAHDRRLGRQLQLHLQPAERQPVRREQLLLERARTAEQLHRGAGVAVLQPGSGVRPQPARLAAQGRHRADLQPAVRRGQAVPVQQPHRRRAARRLVDHAGRDAAGRLPARRQPEHHRHGVPLRRHAASERRAGPGHPDLGRHHRPHHGEHDRQPLLQQGGVRERGAERLRQRAAHARRLLAVAQQRRPVGQQERQDRRIDVGVGAPRSAQHVQHRAVGGAGELVVRQLVVRPDQHARRTTCG